MGILDPGDDTFRRNNRKALLPIGLFFIGLLVFFGVAAKQTGFLNRFNIGGSEETSPTPTPADELTEPGEVEGDEIDALPTEQLSPTASVTKAPTKGPTKAPVKTSTPKPSNTSTPTITPTSGPTNTPSNSPTPTVSESPTLTPITEPSATQTATPTP